MRLFLSYSHDDGEIASEVATALRAAGHHVFLDRDNLEPGGEFHAAIQNALQTVDMILVLISPSAMLTGSYVRRELDIVQHRHPNPVGRILPVIIRPTVLDDIPGYLKAVTLLEPPMRQAAAVIVQTVASAESRARRRSIGRFAPIMSFLAVTVLVTLGAATFLRSRAAIRAPAPTPAPSPLATSSTSLSPEPVPAQTVSGPTVEVPAAIPSVPGTPNTQNSPPILRFDRVTIDRKGSPEWTELDPRTQNRWLALLEYSDPSEYKKFKSRYRCPGDANSEFWCKRSKLFLTTVHGQLQGPFPNPVLDVTVSNVSERQVTILEVGIELAYAAYFSFPGGEPEQGATTVLTHYVISIPGASQVVSLTGEGKRIGKVMKVADACRRLKEEGELDACHGGNGPITIDEVTTFLSLVNSGIKNAAFTGFAWEWADLPRAVTLKLENPWFIKKDAAPYRFSMALAQYENLPTQVVLRVRIKTSDGIALSPYIYLLSPANRSGH